MTTQIRAADHLIDQLVSQGTSHIFGVPGESYLAVLDALHGRNGIDFITCRQEGGAAMAADAYGKLTGRPGVCFVTRGPGATNASAGVHVAFQDSTPMILFIGQVARDMIEREAFQEIDYRRMFGQMAKWVAQIDDANRIQEYVSRAYRIALSGRPGPVVLALPEDMLTDLVRNAPPAARRVSPARYRPSAEGLDALRERITLAERPMIIAGGGGWTTVACAGLIEFAERQGLPVSVSMRAQGVIDNAHPNYVGHFAVGKAPYLVDALQESDLVIAIGPRLGEMTTGGYTYLAAPVPAQKLVHVHPAPEEPGHVYEPDLALTADMESFCSVVRSWEPIAPDRYSERVRTLKSQFVSFGDVDGLGMEDAFAQMVDHLNDVMPEDAIITNGAGNYAGWVHRFYRYRRFGSQLAPTSGSMGYGLPAAIGAAVAAPERDVICFAGDGCFMMTCQELATAAHHGLALTVIVANNNRYGTIRAHQEQHYKGRVSGTALTNPDFCMFAQSFGAGTARVSTLSEFQDALAEARARGGLNLIEVVQDEGILAPGKLM